MSVRQKTPHCFAQQSDVVDADGEISNHTQGRDCGPATIRRPVGASERSELSVRQKMVDEDGEISNQIRPKEPDLKALFDTLSDWEIQLQQLSPEDRAYLGDPTVGPTP